MKSKEKTNFLKKKGVITGFKIITIIYILIALVCATFFTVMSFIDNRDKIQNAMAAKRLALTYQEVGANDNTTKSPYVHFDAYFLQNSGSSTKKVRGATIELNNRQELYLELNVLTNGHLENGQITINANNFNVARDIATDNEIKSSSKRNITLNNIQNGTYKTIPVLIEQNTVEYDMANKNKLTGINSVTFTGTHIAEDGTSTQIEKTVEFKVDWYGDKNLESFTLRNVVYTVSKASDKAVIALEAQMNSQDINDTHIQVPDKAAVLSSTLPLFNGYAPTEVIVIDNSSPARTLNYTYNRTTRRLDIRDEIKYNQDGIGSKAIYGNHYDISINIVYPYAAYSTLGANTRSLNITMQGYLEGYNNPNEGFTNPAKSKTGSKTVNVNIKNPQGDLIIYETEIDLLAKSKLRLKYDRNVDVTSGYRVKWNGKVNYIADLEKLIFEEDNASTIVDGQKFITDHMQASNGTYYDLEGLVSYSGIKIPEASMRLLGEQGEVYVKDTDTGKIIKTITTSDAGKYIKYDGKIKHIRIETSKLQAPGNFVIYNYKQIDNDAFVAKYTKAQFNQMDLVYTSLNGKAQRAGKEIFINRDVESVTYEEGNNLIRVDETMQLNTQMLNQKTVRVNLIENPDSNRQEYNLTEWIDPIILLEYPEEIEKIDIQEITNSDKELTLKEVTQQTINGKKIVKIQMEGVTQEGSTINIKQNIRMNARTVKDTGKLRVFAYNKLCDEWRYIYNNTQTVADIYDIDGNGNNAEERNIGVTELIYTRPTGLYTNTEALNFDDKGTTIMGPSIAELSKQQSGKGTTIRLNIYNNYNTAVTNARIVGKIPFAGNTYQINGGNIGSSFTTTMKSTGIILPDSIKNSVNVYYSEKEIVNENLSDSSNGWTKTPSDWSKVKTYLIDLSKVTMNPGDNYTMDYHISFPEKLSYGTVSYATHAIYFDENTASGKVARSTETNKVGFSVITTNKIIIELTKLQQNTTKPVSGVIYEVKGPGLSESGTRYTTNTEGKITIKNLYPEETYTLKETYAPNGYVLSEEEIKLETYLENGVLKARVLQGKIKGQAIVENGDTDLATVKIQVENQAKYNIELTKYQRGTAKTVQGARFNIKGKGFSESGKTVETNAEGKATIQNLYPNETYTLQEVLTPTGYVLNTTPITFVVNGNGGVLEAQVTSGTVKEYPTINQETRTMGIAIENTAKYSMQIVKYKKGTTEIVRGAKFNIKGKGLVENGKIVETNAEGKVTIQNLYPNEIYTLQEISAPEDYVPDTTPITFIVNDNGGVLEIGNSSNEKFKQSLSTNQETRVVEAIIENESKYNIQITKYEQGTTKVLPNVKFLAKGKGIQEVGSIYVTDENGVITIERLEVGETYTIKETYAKGYYADTSEFTIRLERVNGKLELQYNGRDTKEKTIVEEANKLPVVQIAIENVSIPKYSLELTKIAEKTGKLLAGAKYEVLGAGRDETEEQQYVTAEDGTLKIENLYENEIYTLIEKVAPIGYKLKEEPVKFKATQTNGIWSFEVLEGNFKEAATIEGSNVKVKWEDELLFKLEKVDDETGKPLQGAKYTIKDLSGNNAKDASGNEIGTIENINGTDMRVVTTDENGMITAEVATGLYQVTEVKAPEGYDLPENPTQYFGIEQSQEGTSEYQSTWGVNVGNFDVQIEAMQQIKDGSYILGGYFKNTPEIAGTTLTSKGNYDALIMKYDRKGNLVWTKTIGADQNEYIYTVTATSDGGFIVDGVFESSSLIIGSTTLTNQTGYDRMLVKYNSAGSVEWAKKYNGEQNKQIHAIVETTDGGYIIGGQFTGSIQVGSTTLTSQGESDGMLIKYNSAGTVVWTKSLGGSNHEQISSVAVAKNGDIIVGGYFESDKVSVGGYILTNDTSSYEGMIVRYDASGNVQWAGKIAGTDREEVGAIAATDDGGFILGGQFRSNSIQVGKYTLTGHSDGRGMVIKYKPVNTEEKYEAEWAKTFGEYNTNHIHSIVATDDGKYMVGGRFGGPVTLESGSQVGAENLIIQIENIVITPHVPETQELTFRDTKTVYKNPAEVIVHHYVDGTTTQVPLPDGNKVEDEHIYGETGKAYTTTAKTDLTNYTVVEEKLPENANGNMTADTIEVIYYYTLKDTNVIVHHYVDGTTTQVPLPDGNKVEDETIHGKVGDAYETTAKTDLTNYTVVEEKLPENANGNMTADTIEVIYYYTLKDTNVIVHHYIDGTTTQVPLPDGNKVEDENILGKVGDAYETTAKTDIANYTVVEEKLPTNANGNMTADTTIVIYYYKKANVKVTTEVEGVGGKISGQDQNPYETVNVGEDSIKDLVIIPDENYKVSKITINGEEIEFTEKLDKTVELNTFKAMQEDKHIVVSFEKIEAGKVTVKYLEYGTDKELAPNEEITGKVGEDYTTTRKDIEGYKPYGLDPVNSSGVLTEEEQEVIYYYMRTTGTVIIKYVDADTGEEIASQEMMSGYTGEEYETKSHIKQIDRYTRVDEVVENEEGKYVEGTIEVVYKYRRIPAKVIVQYLEKGTEKVVAEEEEVVGAEGDYYDVTELEKDIKGYSKVEEKPSNKEGEMTVTDIIVKYYYERIPAKFVENAITKDGTSKIVLPVEEVTVSYDITYKAEITDYMGNAKIKITDYLPYEIEEKGDLNGGIYNKEENTITWEETIENIDTYDNGNKEIEITKHIEVTYKNVDFSKDGFVNKAKGKIVLEDTNEEQETPEEEKKTTFEKPEVELESNITKTGTEKIADTKTPVYYEIRYTAKVNNFIGNANIKIVDQLPYAIDENASELQGGTYDKDTKTITWNETAEGINTFKTLTEKGISRVKNISLTYIYDNEETLHGTIDNTVKATTDLVESKEPTPEDPSDEKVVKTDEKQDDHSVEVEIPAKVTVHHYIYDKEANEETTTSIAPSKEISGLVGDSYKTEKSNDVPKNYEVVEEKLPSNANGNMTKTPIEVIYYYQLIDETVTSEINKTAKADKTVEKEVAVSETVQNDVIPTTLEELRKQFEKEVEGSIVVEEPQKVAVEVLTTEGGKVTYNITYKITIQDYIGKAKITIVDYLPAGINVDTSNLQEGQYNPLTKTITWEEEIDGIDTYVAEKAYTKTITKQIEIVYEGQNMVASLENTVKGVITTYYPDYYPNKPGKEKTVEEKEDKAVVEQDYKVNKTVEKVWDDNENSKKKRPASVQMQLTANGMAMYNGQTLENVILSEENSWNYTFKNLPKYDSFGNEIEYSVQENEVNVGDLEYYEAPEISNLDKIIVKNAYRLTNTELDSNITKTGTEKITSSKQEVDYHIDYNANITDYIGEAKVTIVDTLPYEIDEEKSKLAGGKYDKDTRTITWVEELGHINTTKKENNLHPVKIEKDIKLVYEGLDVYADSITNGVIGKIEFTETETKNEKTDEHTTIIDIQGKVIVKYVDKQTGKEITYAVAPGEVGNETGTETITKTYGYEIAGRVGTEYTTELKEIYGYTYVESTANIAGNIKEETQEVIYYYDRTKASDVIVKYVDEEGNEIADEEIIEGFIGDPYKTEEKTIENYELEKMTGDKPEGTLDEKQKEVIYHYRRIPTKVIVRYLEKGSDKPLAEEDVIEGKAGDGYETSRKVITNYQKANPEPENATGTMKKDVIYVTYYYEKIPSGKIIVKYVDIDTNEELTYVDKTGKEQTYTYEIQGYVGEKYKTEEKEIPYYEYLKNLEPVNKEGIYKQDDDTVIYYYRKLTFNISVDKIIKETVVNGEHYKVEKDGKVTKVEVVASRIPNSNVEINYIIRVKNTGEIEGTAKVVDKIPEGFKLGSKNPEYWKKQKDGSITTNVNLKPGETKEFEVVLVWKNGNSNFGGKTNTVEVTDTKNPANYEETTLEDNKSEATVVMSVKTGKEISYVVIALQVVAASGLAILGYQYMRSQKKEE